MLRGAVVLSGRLVAGAVSGIYEFHYAACHPRAVMDVVVEIAAVCFHCPQFRAEVDEGAAEDAVHQAVVGRMQQDAPAVGRKDYAGVAASALQYCGDSPQVACLFR